MLDHLIDGKPHIRVFVQHASQKVHQRGTHVLPVLLIEIQLVAHDKI